MNAPEATQLAVAQQDIKYMQRDIQEIKKNQEQQSEDIKQILERLDNLSGGKQALMWITGLALTISGLIIAWLNSVRHH